MINSLQKSLIDNWSLELAGLLLDGSEDIFSISDAAFIDSLGGLSNYINAILLYDETSFLENGFEADWTRFDWFEKNTKIFVNAINPADLMIDWKSKESYSDKGIKNYLLSSKQLCLDLFISPERSNEITKNSLPEIEQKFNTVLKKIDGQIQIETDKLWFDDLKVGIDKNFKLPSLTHYVLSQASSSDDLLNVIIQLKEDGKINNIRAKINEITENTKTAAKFQKNIENIIKKEFGEKNNADRPWAINLTVLFLTLTRSFNFDFFNRKPYLLFLKDVIACRSEAYSLNDDIKRIFNRKVF